MEVAQSLFDGCGTKHLRGGVPMDLTQETLSQMPPHILLMEDEDSLAKGLRMILTDEGYAVDWAPTGRSALDKFNQRPFDLLMADLRLPDIDGMEVIKQVKKRWPETVVVVITGYASIESAVDAMKIGAFDYLAKPFTDDEIKSVVEGALKEKQLPGERARAMALTGAKEKWDVGDATTRFGLDRRPQLLLLEDEASVAQGLRMVLEEAGYDVDVALTGKKALDIIQKNSFDGLVADLRLPDIDGMEVIRRIKERQPDTAVVVITGYASVASAVDAIKLGAFDYLPKPFTEDEIKAAVEEALNLRESARIKELLEAAAPEEGKLIQKREVIRALDRAARDEHFWHLLLEKGSDALSGFGLTIEAKAAIISGDLNWILKNVGELTDTQLQWVRSRLEMERW